MGGVKCSKDNCPLARECARYIRNYVGKNPDEEKARPDVERLVNKKTGHDCGFFFPLEYKG